MKSVVHTVLVEEKFMPEIHLKQPAKHDKSRFLSCACESFTKSKQSTKKKRLHNKAFANIQIKSIQQEFVFSCEPIIFF